MRRVPAPPRSTASGSGRTTTDPCPDRNPDRELRLPDRLTARQNLAYYGRLYGLTDAALREAHRHLAVVSLTDVADRRVSGFSKGMRQRGDRPALLHEPQVIYFDEPTSGLDPEAAKSIRSHRRVAGGRSVDPLYTHNLDEAERLCDRIGILNRRLMAEGTRPRLAAASAGGRLVQVDGGPVDASVWLGLSARSPSCGPCVPRSATSGSSWPSRGRTRPTSSVSW